MRIKQLKIKCSWYIYKSKPRGKEFLMHGQKLIDYQIFKKWDHKTECGMQTY